MRLQVQSLALLSGLRIRRCRELWCRLQTWLGLRCCGSGVGWRGTAPIQPLAWEPPYAAGAAQDMTKRQKKKTFCTAKEKSEKGQLMEWEKEFPGGLTG